MLAVLGAAFAVAAGALAEPAAASGSGGAGATTAKRGAHVVALQRALGIPADGVFGRQTRRAVRRFQRAHGLVVDGIAGPQTRRALGLTAGAARAGSLLQRIARASRAAIPTPSRPTAATAASTSSRARHGARWAARAIPRRRPSPCRTRWPRSCSRSAARRPGPTAPSASAAPPAPRACAARARARRRRPRPSDVLGHDGVGADDAVVADGHAAQDARAVADPAVVADADVALVDPLQADRPLDLDDAVVEVDQHHAVGDDALAADRHVLEGGDRALLAEHGLGADSTSPSCTRIFVPWPIQHQRPSAASRVACRSRASRRGRRSRGRRSAAARASAASARPSARPGARTCRFSIPLRRAKRSSASGPPWSGGDRRGAHDAGLSGGLSAATIVARGDDPSWRAIDPPPDGARPDPRRAPARRATSARSRAGSRSSRTTTPRAGSSCARSTRTPAAPSWSASPGRRAPASRR